MKKCVSNGYFIGCRDTVVLINKVTMCYAADLKESYSRQCKSISVSTHYFLLTIEYHIYIILHVHTYIICQYVNQDHSNTFLYRHACTHGLLIRTSLIRIERDQTPSEHMMSLIDYEYN